MSLYNCQIKSFTIIKSKCVPYHCTIKCYENYNNPQEQCENMTLKDYTFFNYMHVHDLQNRIKQND